MLNRFLFAGVLVLGQLAAWALAGDFTEWKPVSSKVHEFAARFPETPTQRKQILPTGAEATVFTTMHDDVVYTVVTVKLNGDPAKDGVNMKLMCEEVADGTVRGLNGKVESGHFLVVGGFPAHHVNGIGHVRGLDVVLQHRVVIAGDRVYMIFVQHLDGVEVADEDAEKFFDSFKPQKRLVREDLLDVKFSGN